MEDAGTRELVMVLGLTAVLLVGGLVAVALFIRQWRKEQKERRK